MCTCEGFYGHWQWRNDYVHRSNDRTFQLISGDHWTVRLWCRLIRVLFSLTVWYWQNEINVTVYFKSVTHSLMMADDANCLPAANRLLPQKQTDSITHKWSPGVQLKLFLTTIYDNKLLICYQFSVPMFYLFL